MKNKMHISGKAEEFNLFDFHNLVGGNVLMSYKGPLEENILSSMGMYIRMMESIDEKVSLKIFKIFMELAQNVSFYSAEFNVLGDQKRVGIGSMLIIQQDDHFYFYCGNIVNNIDIIPIIDKCDVINALDREALREFKRKQRRLPRSDFGGSNIGLIQIALTADNPLDIQVTPVDTNNSYFSVGVKIKNIARVKEQ